MQNGDPGVFGPTGFSPNAQQHGALPPTGPMTFDPGAQPGARRTLVGFLVSFQDEREGRFWPLYQGKNVVGRAETGQKVDVEIGHGTTSTVHATIECDGPRLILQDMGSTNGTYHNEEAIGYQGRRELRDGDRVRFGGYTVMLFNVASRF